MKPKRRLSDEEGEDLLERIIGYSFSGAEELLAVLVEVFERIPENNAETLLRERNVRFVLPWFSFAVPRYHFANQNEWLIALRSELHREEWNNRLYTVAHELAHAFLEHNGVLKSPDEQQALELAADRQVIKWGFEEELWCCPYNYLDRPTGQQ